VRSPKEGALEGMSLIVFPNPRERMSTRTSTYLNDSLFIFSLLSHFIEKKYFHRNVGT